MELILLSRFCYSLSEDLNAKPFNVCKVQYLFTLKFRKMRKLLLVLSLLVVFFVGIGMKSLEAQNCWIQPGVSWSGSCVTPDDNTVYIISFIVWNECIDPAFKTFEDTKTVTTNNVNTLFCVPNQLCTADQKDPCFKVVITVAKVNVNTQVVICSKQRVLYKNCEGLIAMDLQYENLILN